jgi:hypothetical protein
MLYNNTEEWAEQIDLISIMDKALGGLSRPANRPTRQKVK